jgi:excisionase family DNA binding protein
MPTTLTENENAATVPVDVKLVPPDAKPVLPPPRLAFSVKETAAMLGVSEKTIRRLVARRLLRSSHALRHLLIPKKEIERFLELTLPK